MGPPTPFVCARCLRAIRLPSIPSAKQTPLTSIRAPRRRYATAARALSSQTSSSRHRQSQFGVRTLTTTPSQTPTPPPPPTSPQPHRPPTDLSTSPPPSQTIALLNPRKDPETGEPWHVDVTPRAARRLQQIMAKDQNPSLCLRVAVESGGCHGFQYMMSLVDSKDVEGEDTVFVVEEGQALGEVDGGWVERGRGKAKVVMDEASLELLKGSKVDYTMELIGSQFKIADNPRATSSCGCGTSFDVKI